MSMFKVNNYSIFDLYYECLIFDTSDAETSDFTVVVIVEHIASVVDYGPVPSPIFATFRCTPKVSNKTNMIEVAMTAALTSW